MVEQLLTSPFVSARMVAIGVVVRFLPIVLLHEPQHSENLIMKTICAHVYYYALMDPCTLIAIVNIKKKPLFTYSQCRFSNSANK